MTRRDGRGVLTYKQADAWLREHAHYGGAELRQTGGHWEWKAYGLKNPANIRARYRFAYGKTFAEAVEKLKKQWEPRP